MAFAIRWYRLEVQNGGETESTLADNRRSSIDSGAGGFARSQRDMCLRGV
jgi:hypothetical protein